jgi:hypothetical protein
MILPSWTFIALKLLSVPVFIWIVSVVANRWGPSIGGVILGLPLTSGPLILFLAIEQGNGFASDAALGTLMGVISFGVSAIVYAWLLFRFSWYISLGGCCAAFFAVTALMNYLTAPPALAFIGVSAFLAIIWKLFPSGSVESAPHRLPKWEIPVRIIAATTLVMSITEGATILGPHLSGLLTPFPVYSTIIATFIQKSEGAGTCALFLRGIITGCFTSTVFLLLVASFIVSLGPLAIGLAVAAAAAMHSLLIYYVQRSYNHPLQ